MTVEKKLLLIIAYQLSGRNRRGCPSCKLILGHDNDCELGKMEDWVQGELMKLWKEVG
ncbi:hypothetical protein LCGC14_0477040 [marine sediment metagenome]|uniref:Uncharacterized protein n=1 Tax=marine sediment metagenome TaxID=412755 RepID=A0A0F9STE6_9ZZZZ